MLKGFSPPPSFAWSCTYHKGYLKDDKNEVLYRQMVLLQRSERLDPKCSLAWLHSQRCVVWHAALRLLYLGQGAYFLYWYMGKWLIQMKPGIQQSTSQAFTSTQVSGGAGGHGHTHWHKMSFPSGPGVSAGKGGGFPSFFFLFIFVAFHERYTWPGHFCLRSTCKTSLGYPNLFQKSDFSIHHPFLETFHRSVLNIMTVLTSINTGQYFLSWSKLLKCCYSISQKASCRGLLGWEQMSSLPTRSKWKTSATKGKAREQQWYVDILVVAEWYFITYSWRRLWTVQDSLGHPGAEPRPQVTCDCVSSSLQIQSLACTEV